MILDHLQNATTYSPLHPLFNRAFSFLKETDFTKLPEGRHEIDGDNLIAIHQSYPTKPEDQGKWEAHRKYIDIQYLLAGRERLGIAPIHTMTVAEDYNPETDLTFFTGTGQFLPLETNHFAIFYPHDVHMPSLRLLSVSQVTKCVMKVRI
jgi:biofilm protein TabA